MNHTYSNIQQEADAQLILDRARSIIFIQRAVAGLPGMVTSYYIQNACSLFKWIHWSVNPHCALHGIMYSMAMIIIMPSISLDYYWIGVLLGSGRLVLFSVDQWSMRVGEDTWLYHYINWKPLWHTLYVLSAYKSHCLFTLSTGQLTSKTQNDNLLWSCSWGIGAM